MKITMGEINYKCGHGHNGEFLGRGSMRAQRIKEISQRSCPACVRAQRVAIACKLTHVDGRPYSVNEINDYLIRHDLR